MPIKFEEQFKHRDERNLKKTGLPPQEQRQKPSIYAGFLHFRGFRFTVLFCDAVTIPTPAAASEIKLWRRAVALGAAAGGIDHRCRDWTNMPGINRTGKK